MAKRPNSQKVLLEHSKIKVQLLGRYLDKYLNIIANLDYIYKIKIYDLFCGEGVYEKGGEGSPLIILDCLKRLHEINPAKNKNIPPIDLTFNDLNPKKIEKLRQIIASKNRHNAKYGSINFSNLDYKSIVSELSKSIGKSRNEKVFIFIDPYGYKEIDPQEIKDLLKSKNSEVLLFLPIQFMYRFGKKGTPEALREFLNKVVNQELWDKNASVWQFINQLKEGFRNFMGADFFVDTFTIQKDPQTVFCMFFFSSHIRGFEKMLEAKWDLDEEKGQGWSYETTFGLFASQKTNPLEEKLLEYLKKEEKTNGELFEFTLRNGFLPKHTTEIFKSWQDRNKLVVFSNKNVKLRKGYFYINYQNFKDSPDRALFKL